MLSQGCAQPKENMVAHWLVSETRPTMMGITTVDIVRSTLCLLTAVGVGAKGHTSAKKTTPAHRMRIGFLSRPHMAAQYIAQWRLQRKW